MCEHSQISVSQVGDDATEFVDDGGARNLFFVHEPENFNRELSGWNADESIDALCATKT